MGYWQETTGYWPCRKTSITLAHPKMLGNYSTWNGVLGPGSIDPSLSILSPHQCYEAYNSALPKIQVSFGQPTSANSMCKSDSSVPAHQKQTLGKP